MFVCVERLWRLGVLHFGAIAKIRARFARYHFLGEDHGCTEALKLLTIRAYIRGMQNQIDLLRSQ
jgi:hypothetical protein